MPFVGSLLKSLSNQLRETLIGSTLPDNLDSHDDVDRNGRFKRGLSGACVNCKTTYSVWRDFYAATPLKRLGADNLSNPKFWQAILVTACCTA